MIVLFCNSQQYSYCGNNINLPSFQQNEVSNGIVNICILPSKTQHMYTKTVIKYQLHQGLIDIGATL